jgi:hypothetical protein
MEIALHHHAGAYNFRSSVGLFNTLQLFIEQMSDTFDLIFILLMSREANRVDLVQIRNENRNCDVSVLVLLKNII